MKKKRNVLQIKTKLEAVTRIANGESVCRIGYELNVGRRTVYRWQKNCKLLQQFAQQSKDSNRYTMKKPKNDIDDALWLWFIQQRQAGIAITRKKLKEKAIELRKEMKNPKNVTKLWLYRWKKRHGVLCDKIGKHSNKIDTSTQRNEDASKQHNDDMQSPQKVLHNDSFQIETILPETLTSSCCIM